MTETLLSAGDVVRVEFDRDAAHLAIALQEDGALNAGSDPTLRLAPGTLGLDQDFSAGAIVVEFIVATTSGITSGVISALIATRLAQRSASTEQPQVQNLPVSEGATERLRLEVKSPPSND